jgi:hypothetical protein
VPKGSWLREEGCGGPIPRPADSSALRRDDHQMVAQDVALIEGRDARVTSKE